MTPLEALAWRRVQRRAALLAPDLRAALFRAWDAIRASLTEPEIARLIASGRLDVALSQALDEASLDRAFAGLRGAATGGVARASLAVNKELPRVAQVPGIAFDVLNPKVTDAIRALNTRAVQTLKDDVWEVVRQAVDRGLTAGVGPREVARQLRDVIGLAPNQEQYVANLRRELETGEYADAARRKMLDQRFNLARLDALSAEAKAARINTIVDAYRKRAIALNAETVTRTLSLDAQRLGQRLSWQDAIERGVIDPTLLMRRYSGVMDSRERPEHVALQGEVVAWDAPYSSGQMYAGEGDWNCRCLDIFFVASAARVAA
jgi:hypothetical protein